MADESIRPADLAGDPVDYYRIVEAIHRRYGPGGRVEFGEIEKLRVYRALLDGATTPTYERRVAAFDQLLRLAIEAMEAPIERVGAKALRAGATVYTKLDGHEYVTKTAAKQAVGKAIFLAASSGYQDASTKRRKGAEKIGAIGENSSQDYCLRFAYSLAGSVLQMEHRLQEAVSSAITDDSLLHEEPWRGRLAQLDQTLAALRQLGFTHEELYPDQVRWYAKSGFIDIGTPDSSLIVAQAETATSIHGVSPFWDHEDDPSEGTEYFEAQVNALRKGAHVKRVFLYELDDEELTLKTRQEPGKAKELRRRGRDAAIVRAEEQIKGVQAKLKELKEDGEKWGTLTTWVTHEMKVREEAGGESIGLPISLRDYSMPSIAVYNHGHDTQRGAAIDRKQPGHYMLSGVPGDVERLFKLFLIAKNRGHEQMIAP